VPLEEIYYLEFGSWMLVVICDLKFGISCQGIGFSDILPTDHVIIRYPVSEKTYVKPSYHQNIVSVTNQLTLEFFRL